MSGSSRSRQKRKLEPISLEELAGTTGMSGFCSFLTRDNSVAVPALDHLETGAPDLHAPDLPAPVSAAPVIDAVEVSAPGPGTSAPILITQAPSAVETDADETSAPDLDAYESTAPDYVFRRKVRIRETSIVQDGHSLAEQAVYDAMYRAGKPYQGDSRILTIGLRTLADLSRMAYSNCKANVRSLVAKLAIEERPGFSYTDGRTYVIFSFREILRRRKSGGLTHVIRNRGVAFVDPETGKPLLSHQIPESGAPDSTAAKTGSPFSGASASSTGALESDRSGAPANPQSGAPATPAHIRNRHLQRNESEATASFLGPIVAALRKHIPDVDDDAAAELWNRCRGNAPGAEIAEVVHFVDLKAGKPGIRMPLGFLLSTVPKCFAGDSYRQFREERESLRRAGQARDRQFAEEILRSPDADEEQKQWAREVLTAP
jgi:hypothetical protein